MILMPHSPLNEKIGPSHRPRPRRKVMFDPEKVERYNPEIKTGYGMCQTGSKCRYVRASDYDQLLEIHLRHVGMIAELFSKCGEPLSAEKIASLKNGTWR